LSFVAPFFVSEGWKTPIRIPYAKVISSHNSFAQREFGHRPLGSSVEAASAWPRAPLGDMAAGKRGLKRGLATRERTVILMLDETIILLHGYLKQLLTSAISGEGVVLRFSGEGKVLICSRNRDESHTSTPAEKFVYHGQAVRMDLCRQALTS
jgi:hypothetical protein